MTSPLPGFATRVVRWQRSHGRNDLPWQGSRDPYRVWLSEIMLQQTQVATVMPYYQRFLERFPDVTALAAAPLDEVLALWSGLGYYSRARNLHRCAGQVVVQHGGRFPTSAAALMALPGIGRSTAAAIAAFCFGERIAILDGNVKRVLARCLAWSDDLAVAANERALWAQAQALLPHRGAADSVARYTQGLMDLGATVCLPRQPACPRCPVHDLCGAARAGRPQDYPVRTRALRRTAQALWLLEARSASGAVWLHKRPARGIWAALYCLPAFDSLDALRGALPSEVHGALRPAPAFVHPLTHKDLLLHPVRLLLPAAGPAAVPCATDGAWFEPGRWPALGLPAPIRKLLSGADAPT